tara:strand:+ start:617 stop:1060 length:444 start_codon:yes stop_codon:yes gene_type:complete
MPKLTPNQILIINKCHLTLDDIWTLEWRTIKPAEGLIPGPKDEQIAKQHKALDTIINWHDIEDDDGLRASLVCTCYDDEHDLSVYDTRQMIIDAGMSLAFVDITSEASEMQCHYVLFSPTHGVHTSQLPVLNDAFAPAATQDKMHWL